MRIFLILPILLLSGCLAGVETSSGWHMASLPPSSGKRLREQCSVSYRVMEKSQSKLSLISEMMDKREENYKSIIRELEMENMALKSANELLHKRLGNGKQ